MSSIRIELFKVPSDVSNEQKFAPRTDGVSNLPRSLAALGFAPTSVKGDVVDVDLAARGMTMADVPPHCRVVEAVTLVQPQSNRPGFEMVNLHAGAGDTVHLPPRQAQAAIAAGIAVAA